jgi:hypothetical protein
MSFQENDEIGQKENENISFYSLFLTGEKGGCKMRGFSLRKTSPTHTNLIPSDLDCHLPSHK